MYKIVRVSKKADEEFYKYSVNGNLEYDVYTNYRSGIKKAIWYSKYQNETRLEQYNQINKMFFLIPIVNAIEEFLRHRKYKIFFNNEPIGHVDETHNGLSKRIRFVVKDKEYFIGQGNTFVLRPFKNYEWPLETKEGEPFAIVKSKNYEPVYSVEIIKNELDITLIILMVIICDMYWFSSENETPAIYC